MKKKSLKHSLFVLLSLTVVIAAAFPSKAAVAKGKITRVDSTSICGWAWNPDDTNDVQQVELHIFQSGKAEPVKYLHVTADEYREDLAVDLKDGWHGFSVKVDWSQFSGNDFKIKAYTVKGDEYYILGDTVDYKKGSSGADKQASKVPEDTSSQTAAQAATPVTGERSLGLFSVCGYCNCEKCGGGSGLTYSGTVPQANHTIAADLSILPLGSKVRIGNVIYTVEDIGSAIQGNIIDVYCDTHEIAVSLGLTKQEVFLVQ